MEEHSSKRKQFWLRHGHGLLGTLSSRTDLTRMCACWEKHSERGISLIPVVCIWWHLFSFVRLLCEISVSKAKERPGSSMSGGRSGLSSASTAPCTYALACFCEVVSYVDRWSSGTQRVKKMANWSARWGDTSPVPLDRWARVGWTYDFFCPNQDTFESALFNYAKTAGGTFNGSGKTWMCGHPCPVVIGPPN